MYLYATAIGLSYSAFLYAKFGINIFDYSEISDFIVAAFKNPRAFIAVGGQVAVFLVVRIISRQAGYSWSVLLQWITIGFVLLAFFASVTFAPYRVASETASSIKQGDETKVDVRYRSFKGSAGQVTARRLQLIGATQRATFFYDHDADNENERTLVIPQAQIISIEVPE